MTAPASELKFAPIVHLEAAIRRDRLLRQVLEAPPGAARLALVIAPAGFGKTTVLAQIAETLAAAGEPVAWLNCDRQVREPGAFIGDLASAWHAAGLPGFDTAVGLAGMTQALATLPARATSSSIATSSRRASRSTPCSRASPPRCPRRRAASSRAEPRRACR